MKAKNAINQVKEVLALMYTRLQHLTEDGSLSSHTGDTIMSMIAGLETTTWNLLSNPKAA